MAGQKKPKPHDLSEQIVLKAVHDKTGWRVVLHIHDGETCVLLEGHARFTTEEACHAHGHDLHRSIDAAIGLTTPTPAPKLTSN